jgi:Putative bacterial lipoprotein (DUF799)
MVYRLRKGPVGRTGVTIFGIAFLAVAAASCSTQQQESRPFFLPEQGAESHGRKTWFDHLVELDPGRVHFQVAADYADDPPQRVAVLPFTDHGSAQYVLDKIPLTHRDTLQRQEWAWTYANRLRRSFQGELAEREFVVIPMVGIDTVLADHGINDWGKLRAVPPEQLGRWFGADAVVFGEVLHYEAYYAFLVSGWDVGVRVRMVSTRDGHELFSATDKRFSVDLQPAFDPICIAINSGMTLLELRDVTLARAEDEVSREIAFRIPVSSRSIADLQEAARARADEETVSGDERDSPATQDYPSADSGRMRLRRARYLIGQRL